MARKNARKETDSRASRKAAGTKKAVGSRKAAGARKTGSRKSTGARGGARKGSGSRKSAGGKSEAREMGRTSRAGGAKTRASGRTRRTSTRRAGGVRKTSGGRATTVRGRSKGQYSASAQRALWIESPDQHAERPGQTLATRDHDVIRQWAEERGAVPATIAGTEHDGRPGVLRFDFPNFGRSGGRLRPVDWDEWFETFDQRNLVFLFQEQMKNGNQSNFFRLDSPDREEA